jgi:hypothetical protein
MKFSRKIMAMVLAVMMVAGISIQAMAATVTDPTATVAPDSPNWGGVQWYSKFTISANGAISGIVFNTAHPKYNAQTAATLTQAFPGYIGIKLIANGANGADVSKLAQALAAGSGGPVNYGLSPLQQTLTLNFQYAYGPDGADNSGAGDDGLNLVSSFISNQVAAFSNAVWTNAATKPSVTAESIVSTLNTFSGASLVKGATYANIGNDINVPAFPLRALDATNIYVGYNPADGSIPIYVPYWTDIGKGTSYSNIPTGNGGSVNPLSGSTILVGNGSKINALATAGTVGYRLPVTVTGGWSSTAINGVTFTLNTTRDDDSDKLYANYAKLILSGTAVSETLLFIPYGLQPGGNIGLNTPATKIVGAGSNSWGANNGNIKAIPTGQGYILRIPAGAATSKFYLLP